MDHLIFRRTCLVGWLVLQSGVSLPSAFAEQGAGMSPGGHGVKAVQQSGSNKRDLAIVRAREALRAAGVDPSALTVTGAEQVTWPDSSLGCPQAGIQYLQVLTAGYRVELAGAQEKYVVHVAGNRSVVCTGPGGTGSGLKRPIVPVRGIDVMTQRARQMLAAVVHAPAQEIHVAGIEPQVWSDTGLGCPSSADQSVPGRVSGFKIMLEHGGRAYSFNTDLHRVIACPAIDAE